MSLKCADLGSEAFHRQCNPLCNPLYPPADEPEMRRSRPFGESQACSPEMGAEAGGGGEPSGRPAHKPLYVARSCKISRALDHLAMNSDVEQFIHACQIFRQGDAERKAGLPISPLMDRHKGGISKSQEGVSGVSLGRMLCFASTGQQLPLLYSPVSSIYDFCFNFSVRSSSPSSLCLSSRPSAPSSLNAPPC